MLTIIPSDSHITFYWTSECKNKKKNFHAWSNPHGQISGEVQIVALLGESGTRLNESFYFLPNVLNGILCRTLCLVDLWTWVFAEYKGVSLMWDYIMVVPFCRQGVCVLIIFDTTVSRDPFLWQQFKL